MLKGTVPLICAIATFVLLIDNQKAVGAASLQRKERAVEGYTTKFDNIDVDRILQSERLLRNYLNCLLDKGKCTPDGQELKRNLSDALATECAKCSEKQKKQAGKVLSFILQNHRDYWEQLLEKYDPDGNFRKKYEEGADDDK